MDCRPILFSVFCPFLFISSLFALLNSESAAGIGTSNLSSAQPIPSLPSPTVPNSATYSAPFTLPPSPSSVPLFAPSSFAVLSPPISLFSSRPLAALLISALVIVLIVATVLGNLMVCVAIALVRKLKAQPANLLLVSLAVADFCVGLFVMPLAAVYLLDNKWPFGPFICRFWVTADLTLCTASILNLCMISVDRHLAVTRALRYSAIRTRRRICAYIGVVWVGAVLVSAVPLAFLPFWGHENVCQVSQNRFFQIFATIFAFWGPALIMVIVYVKLWNAAKEMQRQDRMVLRWQGMQCQNNTDSVPNSNGFPAEKAMNNSHSSASLLATANAQLTNTPRNSTRQKVQRQSIEQDKNNNTSNKAKADGEGRGKADKPRASACSLMTGAIRIPLLGSYSSTASSVVGALTGGGFGKSHHSQCEDKARKTLGVMMSVFLCCWVPFFILALLKSQRLVLQVPTWLDSLALWLGYSNRTKCATKVSRNGNEHWTDKAAKCHAQVSNYLSNLEGEKREEKNGRRTATTLTIGGPNRKTEQQPPGGIEQIAKMKGQKQRGKRRNNNNYLLIVWFFHLSADLASVTRKGFRELCAEQFVGTKAFCSVALDTECPPWISIRFAAFFGVFALLRSDAFADYSVAALRLLSGNWLCHEQIRLLVFPCVKLLTLTIVIGPILRRLSQSVHFVRLFCVAPLFR
ncbi:hypothetical protein niasHT_022042 [Heterodera trifolii]|uniref:G-protein coupled receptors family 1 profile domain-containing protein n=1 Tax=Heterodera trifolii TaxID=157864 RepID=A0ABD2JJN4_9BILA